MDFAADLSIFHSDFATSATLNGVPVTGLYKRQYGEAFGLVAGVRPTYRLAASIPAARGQSLVIGANAYTVTAIEPISTLENLLILDAA